MDKRLEAMRKPRSVDKTPSDLQNSPGHTPAQVNVPSKESLDAFGKWWMRVFVGGDQEWLDKLTIHEQADLAGWMKKCWIEALRESEDSMDKTPSKESLARAQKLRLVIDAFITRDGEWDTASEAEEVIATNMDAILRERNEALIAGVFAAAKEACVLNSDTCGDTHTECHGSDANCISLITPDAARRALSLAVLEGRIEEYRGSFKPVQHGLHHPCTCHWCKHLADLERQLAELRKAGE